MAITTHKVTFTPSNLQCTLFTKKPQKFKPNELSFAQCIDAHRSEPNFSFRAVPPSSIEKKIEDFVTHHMLASKLSPRGFAYALSLLEFVEGHSEFPAKTPQSFSIVGYLSNDSVSSAEVTKIKNLPASMLIHLKDSRAVQLSRWNISLIEKS